MPAVFIGRFQPLHKGHLSAIKWILQREKEVFIVVGSLQEFWTKENPFSFKERENIVKETLLKNGIKNFKIFGLPDFFDDNLWLKKFFEMTKLKENEITVYTQNEWTKRCFENSRAKVLPHPIFFNGLCGTEIREKIFKNEKWRRLVPTEVLTFLDKVKGEERIKFTQVLPERRIIDFIKRKVKKAGAKGAIIGISGGIDSALAAYLTKKALGDKAFFLWLPFIKNCPFGDNIKILENNLKTKIKTIYFDGILKSFSKFLPEGNRISYGNLEPRIRMTILYYFANLYNLLVIGTGNKSEKETGYFCYDKKTRALTKEGLKSYYELKPEDIVFSLDIKTAQVIETRVKKIYTFDYNGKMLRYGGGLYSKTVDLLITSNHRLLIEKKGEVEFCEVDKLLRRPTPTPLPKPWKGIQNPPAMFKFDNKGIGKNARRFSSIPIKDFLYILGLYIGDGNTQTSSIRQFIKETGNYKYWRDTKTGRFIYKVLPFFQKEYSGYRTWFALPEGSAARSKLLIIFKRNNIPYGITSISIWICGRPFYEALKNCTSLARTKQIPSIFLDYPADYLRSLLDGLMDSDGDRRNYYYTTSKQLAEQIVELGYKLGKNATIRRRGPRIAVRKDGVKIYSSRSYEISIYGNGRRWLNGAKFKKVYYRGKIWCPDIPKVHNLLIERNGRFLFCGNTKYGDGGVDIEPIADLYKTEVIKMAKRLELPNRIIKTVPTAALWPGQTDEKEIGITYQKLDTVLKLLSQGFSGKEISVLTDVSQRKIKDIIERKKKNLHKLSSPPICKLTKV